MSRWLLWIPLWASNLPAPRPSFHSWLAMVRTCALHCRTLPGSSLRGQYEPAECHRHPTDLKLYCIWPQEGCSNPKLRLPSPQVHQRHCAPAGLYSAALDLAAVLAPLPQQAGPKVLGGRHLKQLTQVFRSMATDCVERQLQGQSEPQPLRQPSAGEAGAHVGDPLSQGSASCLPGAGHCLCTCIQTAACSFGL